MKTIKINKDNIQKSDLELIVKYLKQGKVVVIPTDTVYGFSCLATSKKGTLKIHQIKKSSPDKPMIVFVNSLKMLSDYAEISKKQRECLKNLWSDLASEIDCKIAKKEKRAVTVILNKKPRALKHASAGQDSVALRLPKCEIDYKIIKELGLPIVSTSLNISGKEPIKDLAKIEEEFTVLPDLVVDAGKMKNGKPSRLIDIRDINNIKIIRK